MNREEFIKTIRDFEKKLQDNMDKVFCPTHLSLGHERVAADIHEVFRNGDWLFSTHRNHHHYLAASGSLDRLWDEIMGLESGVNGGFSGSQGYSDPSINFHASAIVGGLVGTAVGAAYALKMAKTANIAICCIGDAGTEGGVFWEALNFSALHRLPIAFICENNGMSVDSPIKERQAMPLNARVEAFGIELCATPQEAIETAREGIPTFHEAIVTLECDHLNMSTLMPSLGLK